MFENLLKAFEVAENQINFFMKENNIKHEKKEQNFPLSEMIESASPNLMTREEANKMKDVLAMEAKKAKDAKELIDNVMETISRGLE